MPLSTPPETGVLGRASPFCAEGAAIGRDSAGIHAFSLVCTHAGCDMSVDGPVSAGSVQCFCHGSVFDAQGNLTIHGDQTCAPETRLPA